MKVNSFFKLLNRKIKQYEKAVTNPYIKPKYNYTVIWIEDTNPDDKT